MKVNYKGYTMYQHKIKDYHLVMFENVTGNFVCHTFTTKKLTRKEMKREVDLYIAVRDSRYSAIKKGAKNEK